jgi:hypothetical protein
VVERARRLEGSRDVEKVVCGQKLGKEVRDCHRAFSMKFSMDGEDGDGRWR